MTVCDFLMDLRSKADSVTGYTEEEVNEFVWDIITALRTCDYIELLSSDFLKFSTTARLRSVVGLRGRSVGFIINTVPLNSIEQKSRNEQLAIAPWHFAAHWGRAVEAVKVLYKYDLETETPCD